MSDVSRIVGGWGGAERYMSLSGHCHSGWSPNLHCLVERYMCISWQEAEPPPPINTPADVTKVTTGIAWTA